MNCVLFEISDGVIFAKNLVACSEQSGQGK
jgi:hypothetical protein